MGRSKCGSTVDKHLTAAAYLGYWSASVACMVNIPGTLKAKSVQIRGPKCCMLYRAACPTAKFGDWPQIPLFLNQRIYSDVADLEPLGFSDIVRSVVCPHEDVCNGVLVDHEYYGEEDFNVKGYWVDVRYLEKQQNPK
ncbi:hypothetical protein B0T14DRAFT_570973 [Immersiella caudata]|uniref:Uncharacterized protein n=1 Tax=Immersiella caudata TaxID=314043 RepID=A0AA39TN13_9PEZI|nr:hypothetical protein B0T14DRAFT_570973 [Immersiella caudata]